MLLLKYFVITLNTYCFIDKYKKHYTAIPITFTRVLNSLRINNQQVDSHQCPPVAPRSARLRN